MTQEDKELLLKDLCARLPYGVKVTYNISGNHFGTISKICEYKTDYNIFKVEDGYNVGVYSIKPYLRPMSSMTEKEKKEHDFYCGYKPYDENIGESYLTEYDMPDYIDFLYEHHLDFRGLIPMGLALEAPEDMYKIE